MQFGVIGINYKNAGLSVRDHTTFTDQRRIDFLQKAESAGINQCMVLSTCNRSEIYFFFNNEEQMLRMEELYTGFFKDIDLRKCLFMKQGRDAMEYLFKVASGLESLVLGEDQIKGQVQEALDFSRMMGSCKKELDKIVRNSISCSKQIKTELRIDEKPLSVSYVGIQQLREACGIAGKRVLVIGSGKTASLALKYLYEDGAEHVIICSRDHSHASALREEYPEIEAAHFADRYELLDRCDIVISATSSPHLVIRAEELISTRPTAFLDLASPRDVDPEIGRLDGMTLINLDTLTRIVKENQKERERLVEQSRRIVEQWINDTQTWILKSGMDSTIESLQQRCSEIVEDSYSYLDRKLDLSTREQKILKKVLNASLQRLLHEPINEMKKLDTKETQIKYQVIVKQLFQI